MFKGKLASSSNRSSNGIAVAHSSFSSKISDNLFKACSSLLRSSFGMGE